MMNLDAMRKSEKKATMDLDNKLQRERILAGLNIAAQAAPLLFGY